MKFSKFFTELNRLKNVGVTNTLFMILFLCMGVAHGSGEVGECTFLTTEKVRNVSDLTVFMRNMLSPGNCDFQTNICSIIWKRKGGGSEKELTTNFNLPEGVLDLGWRDYRHNTALYSKKEGVRAYNPTHMSLHDSPPHSDTSKVLGDMGRIVAFGGEYIGPNGKKLKFEVIRFLYSSPERRKDGLIYSPAANVFSDSLKLEDWTLFFVDGPIFYEGYYMASAPAVGIPMKCLVTELE